MATRHLQFPANGTSTSRIDATKNRERALSRMLTTYIVTGLAFMLLPGTFLGVWNLIAISSQHAASSISPSWIQAHGQAQVFGWIGTFILGIGFYSIPKMRRAQAFAMWEAWACWAMWTIGVALRWITTVYELHWRVLLPLSAALQLLAFVLFFKTVSSHRPEKNGTVGGKLDRWIFVVILGTVGLLSSLVVNLYGSLHAAIRGFTPAFGSALDQHLLVLMAWGFMVPFVWGFSARWLPTFLGLRAPCEHGMMAMIAIDGIGLLLASFGYTRMSSLVFLAAGAVSVVALRVALPPIQKAKINGIHWSFPYFVRLAYFWLLVAALLGVWAAWATDSVGILGASRHALTVGFIATMVFAIGARVLPAFSGMRLLYSPKLMGASLFILTVGCSIRVSCETLAYQGMSALAWRMLPISAITELLAVTLFAINMIATFLSRPPSTLVRVKPAT
jgi:uncharacterized protein involved in response to NO